jgi:hypothetical protein
MMTEDGEIAGLDGTSIRVEPGAYPFLPGISRCGKLVPARSEGMFAVG